MPWGGVRSCAAAAADQAGGCWPGTWWVPPCQEGLTGSACRCKQRLVTLFGPASKRIPLAEGDLSSIQQAALMLHQEVILQVKRCPVMTSSHWQAILEASSRSRNWSIHMRFLMMLGVTIRAVQLRLMTDFEGADSQDF